MAILHRREGPDDPPVPAAALERGEDVLARFAAIAADDADRTRQLRARQLALALEQAVVGERLSAALDLDEQVAGAGDP